MGEIVGRREGAGYCVAFDPSTQGKLREGDEDMLLQEGIPPTNLLFMTTQLPLFLITPGFTTFALSPLL